jgi:hypothetical protein
MNKFIIIVLISFNTFSQNKESFEGIIIYENTFISKIDSISNSHFENAYGKQTKYVLDKNGDYINLYKGSYITIQLYKKKEDIIYTLLTGRDTIFYNKTNEKTDDISNIKETEKQILVLDKNCNEIIYETSTSKYKYYYNNDFYIDPKLYSNHYLGNWNQIVGITKSFPMKVILETDYFIMTSTAISVKKGAVEKQLFSLPPNIPISKAKENLFLK